MRETASRSLRRWTYGLVVAVVVLVALECSDRFVPPAWQAPTPKPFLCSAQISYKDSDDLRWANAGLYGGYIEFYRGVKPTKFSALVTSGDRRLGGVVTSSSVFVQMHEMDTATAECCRLGLSGLETSATQTLAGARPDLVPLVSKAFRSPEQHIDVERPERMIVARLMETRGILRRGGVLMSFWLLVVPSWLLILAWRWRPVLWPEPENACASCRYDRSGLAADTPCPECGKSVGAKAT